MPCEAYWNSSAVFLGTVNNSTTTTVKQGEFNDARRVFRFTVDTAFRGVAGREVEVVTGFGDADCGYGFQLGRQYLVYAHRNDAKVLSTSICSRTRPASEATDDLAYFRELSKAPPEGTIFGEVKLNRRQETAGHEPAPMKGVRILIGAADKSYEAITDEKGKYEVSGVTGGTYRVKVELPAGTNIHNSEREVTVAARGCAQATFWLEPDTRVTGRVMDAQGLPASDVLMELVPVKDDQTGFPSYVRTGTDGRYEMKLVHPGRYLLGVRIAGSAGSTHVPFPQTYYPGVSDRSGATIVSISEGQHFEADDLILPPRLIERQLNGIVRDSSGKAVRGATVWLKDTQYINADMPYRKETDAEGRFSFLVYEGMKYSLNANLDEVGRARRQSDSVDLIVSANPEPLTLVLR